MLNRPPEALFPFCSEPKSGNFPPFVISPSLSVDMLILDKLKHCRHSVSFLKAIIICSYDDLINSIEFYGLLVVVLLATVVFDVTETLSLLILDVEVAVNGRCAMAHLGNTTYTPIIPERNWIDTPRVVRVQQGG